MPQRSQEILIQGKPFSYLYEGEGLPCIVCGIASYYPPTLPEALKSSFQFIYADLWWTGAHPELDINAVTMDSLVDQLDELRKQLGFPKIAILGHSIFGLLALRYCCKYPQHVAMGVIIGSPATWTQADQQKAENYWQNEASAERHHIYNQNMRELEAIKATNTLTEDEIGVKTYLATAPKYWLDPHYDCAYLWQGIKTNRKLLNHFIQNIVKEYDPSLLYSQAKCPIFVAMGKYDYALPPLLWDQAKTLFPQLSFHVFEQSAHYPQMDEPEKFTALLIEYLKNCFHALSDDKKPNPASNNSKRLLL